MKVLGVFANPRGSSALRLGEEDRTIRECIRRSRLRDQIQLTIVHAATIDDLRRALLDDEFSVVHFSGHGTNSGLVFEDRDGALYVPPMDALASLLLEYCPPLECVVLNACYSISQGKLTSFGLPWTIAMELPISDDAAIQFAGAFYDSLAAGKAFDFSFRQGLHALRLAGHPDKAVPVLLRHGESAEDRRAVVSPDSGVPARAGGESSQFLVGIVLDVSGSMRTNISNRDGEGVTRLEAFNRGLSTASERVQRVLESPNTKDVPVQVFAYAFGMRAGGVADLLTLIRAADDVATPEVVARITQRHTQEISESYASADSSGLESLARSYGLGGLVDSVIADVRRNAEEEVRRRVIGELYDKLRARAQQIGDTTLSVADLTELWRRGKSTSSHVEELVFGDTPMCAALVEVRDRLRREFARISGVGSLVPLLLLVTDGESTDGDPIPLARELRDMGVIVVTCYIAEEDVATPWRLVTTPGESWPAGAKTGFEMSSILAEDSALVGYLVSRGWSVEREAHCFVQANHTDLLSEIIEFALSVGAEPELRLPIGQ